MDILLKDISIGVFLSLLYLEMTLANDTTFRNIINYTLYFVVLVNSARLLNVNSEIIVNSFITKTIFTVIDERMKRYASEKKSIKIV